MTTARHGTSISLGRAQLSVLRCRSARVAESGATPQSSAFSSCVNKRILLLGGGVPPSPPKPSHARTLSLVTNQDGSRAVQPQIDRRRRGTDGPRARLCSLHTGLVCKLWATLCAYWRSAQHFLPVTAFHLCFPPIKGQRFARCRITSNPVHLKALP